MNEISTYLLKVLYKIEFDKLSKIYSFDMDEETEKWSLKCCDTIILDSEHNSIQDLNNFIAKREKIDYLKFPSVVMLALCIINVTILVINALAFNHNKTVTNVCSGINIAMFIVLVIDCFYAVISCKHLNRVNKDFKTYFLKD